MIAARRFTTSSSSIVQIFVRFYSETRESLVTDKP